MRPRLPIVTLYVATAWIVFVAVRIEVLNARAGYRLPNDAVMAESRRDGGSGAWRATWMDEERWRRWYIRDVHGNPDPRPLTAEEQERMRRDIQRANANYRLRDFVGGFGCLQYLVILVVVMSGIQLARRERQGMATAVLCWLAVGIATAAGGLAIYRGYVRSLID